MKEVVPQHARDIFAGGKEKSPDILVLLPVHRGRYEEVFD
jgi:hypothetical protein